VPEISIGDAELYYESHGEGPPLILVSGLGGYASFWAPHVSELARNFRTITFDHRGIGGSTKSRIRYSVEQMADDVVKLMDALGIGRASLIGHSTGGCIGAIIAIEHPDRLSRVAMISSWAKADAYFARLFETRMSVLEEQGPEAYVRHGSLFQYPPWWIAEHMEELRLAERRAVDNFPPTEIVLSRMAAIVAYDRLADLGSIEVPVLVHVAKDDVTTPPYFSEELHARIPDSALHVIERGGHFCPHTAAQEFRETVVPFLLDHG
jgi:aminoacrylate hydrolase